MPHAQKKSIRMRLRRIHLAPDLKILLLAGGFLAGWLLTRRRRAAAAMSLATLVLAAGMGGPIPITGSLKAAGLFGAFLVIYALCGITLAVFHAGVAKAALRRSAAES